MNIIIGSKNPVKVSAIKQSFITVFPKMNELCFKDCDVDSGVGRTPLTREDTKLGASNRLKIIKERFSRADYYAVIEDGFYRKSPEENYRQIGSIIVADRSDEIEVSVIEFGLPTELSRMIASGKGCGSSVDELRGQKNSKQNTGVSGYVSDDNRYEVYLTPLIIAWNQLRNYDEMYR